MQQEKSRCSDCPAENRRVCMLYCLTDNKPLCGKCGANKHRNCTELLDWADMIRATSEAITNKLDELVNEGKKGSGTEKKVEGESLLSLDELEAKQKKVLNKKSENEGAGEECVKYLEEKLKLKKEDLGSTANSLLNYIDEMLKNLRKLQNDKEAVIEGLKRDREALNLLKGDDCFDEILRKYKLAKGEYSGSDANLKKMAGGFPEEFKNFCSDNSIKSIEKDIKHVFEKPKIETICSQSMPNFVHYLNPLSHELYTYDVETGEAKRIELFGTDDKPFILPEGFDSVAALGQVYIVGGTTDGETCLDTTSLYSPFRERVVTLPAKLIHSRKEHVLEYNDGYIYCIAGRSKDGLIGHCERLNITQGEQGWEALPDLPQPRMGPSVCAIRDSRNPCIYVFGGLSQEGCISSLERLLCSNPKEWTKMPIQMCAEWKIRYAAGAFATRNEHGLDQIMIFGGTEENDYNTTYSIEYSPEADKWIMNHLTAANLSSATSFNQRKPIMSRNQKRVFVIGSFEIHNYNVESQAWEAINEENWHPI